MRCGAGPLVLMAAVFWTQCVLLHGVDAKKERKRAKEAAPQQTETLNATISNSEEVGGSIKVVTRFHVFQTLIQVLLDRKVLQNQKNQKNLPLEPRRKRLEQNM